VARTRTTLGLAPIVAGAVEADDGDELTARLLDAAATLLADYGLHRWSMDDVAERSGVGRTTVYRRFANRDRLVHAVLARELRTTIAAVAQATLGFARLEDKVVEGALVALDRVEGSLVERLLRSDPTTFLPFLTTEAAPLLAMARQLLAGALVLDAGVDPTLATELAELVARLGLSFLLTPETVFPKDKVAARRSIERVLGPVLASLVPAGVR
jgi:AcrR family transcriptional regulator